MNPPEVFVSSSDLFPTNNPYCWSRYQSQAGKKDTTAANKSVFIRILNYHTHTATSVKLHTAVSPKYSKIQISVSEWDGQNL